MKHFQPVGRSRKLYTWARRFDLPCWVNDMLCFLPKLGARFFTNERPELAELIIGSLKDMRVSLVTGWAGGTVEGNNKRWFEWKLAFVRLAVSWFPLARSFCSADVDVVIQGFCSVDLFFSSRSSALFESNESEDDTDSESRWFGWFSQGEWTSGN